MPLRCADGKCPYPPTSLIISSGDDALVQIVSLFRDQSIVAHTLAELAFGISRGITVSAT
jgi:hypothetical protein